MSRNVETLKIYLYDLTDSYNTQFVKKYNII